ncbi:ubiquitin-conjugating enzyme E2 J1 protein [Dioscorea alata]|uniref:Ubiquitin-conjugating enzyme E2 J1 protein n=1 Tax=Dioscorea alata TaxID=55571 RepID=A0ACB7V034_DIOAL|nr:ubiquitin-conjugating enzyme E2 J1 protein [Dioscorea alata]
MADERYNRKNPAVKRILQEVKEMQSNPSDDFMSLPLEENIFEWQFAICGPRDSEFEGGIYHGRIQLPAEYPFKPPAFMLLTPNGRFETQTKICLSISNYHPEHWQPSWSVRTALVALIAFMPTNPDGALGSLDYNKEERRKLAIKSREVIPKYGSPERQNLIDEIHRYMLSKAPPVPDILPTPATDDTSEEANAGPNSVTENASPDVATTAIQEPPNPENEPMMVEDVHEVQVNAAAGPVRVGFHARVSLSRRAPASHTIEQPQRPVARAQKPSDDRLFTLAAIGLTIAISILILKKFLKSYGIFLM